MYFQSVTDLDIIQTPSVPAAMLAPAGSIAIDPDFQNQIIRFTDEVNATMPTVNMSAGIGGSADVNVWNTDSTMIYLADSGGAGAIYGFNPLTLAVCRLFPAWRVSGPLVFSRLDPNIAFNFSGTQFLQYNLSNRNLPTPPAPKLICDFVSQLPGAYTWKTIGGVEGADKVFTAAFSVNGGQGSGVYACSFSLGQGFRTYNTASGQITGDFGTTGSVPIPDRFTIHNVKSSKDGQTLVIGMTDEISGSDYGPFFWNIASTYVSAMNHAAHGGHWTAGFGDFLNNASSPQIPNWAHCQRLLTNLGAPWRVANPSPDPHVMYNIDDHLSYNGPNGSMFVSTSTSSPSKTIPPAPYPAAWWDEVLGFDLSGNGLVYRFCHHFSDTHSGLNFDADNAIGVVDQLNKFVAFTSNCQLKLKNQRSDVYVVVLR